ASVAAALATARTMVPIRTDRRRIAGRLPHAPRSGPSDDAPRGPGMRRWRKEFRPLMYLRVIGPCDRLRSKEEVLADARRSTDDAAHLDWVSRVYDGTVASEDEAGHLAHLLDQRLDRLERALDGRDYLVGDGFTIADVSVLPRVAMYP